MDPGRELVSLRLPGWGRVAASPGEVVPYFVRDEAGERVEPISVFLRDFLACGNRRSSARSYCYALLRWWRFLLAVDVPWDRAGPAEGRDYVLWLGQADKPVAGRRTRSAATAGRVNQVTRKPYPGDKYQPRTIRNGNAVVRAFYEFWIEQGAGPLLNPMPLQRRDERTSIHQNPLRPFPAQGRLRYNPPVPKRTPRMMPDQEWDAFFAALRSDRDRAIVSLAVSTGARASELLGMTSADVDWGNQLICVRRKGTDAPQCLAASPESFVWLRLYLAGVEDLRPGDPLWWTLRRYGAGAAGRGRAELNYDALRAVFRRANELLGTNWSMHDLRHTCAVRMEMSGVASDASFPGTRDHGAVRD